MRRFTQLSIILFGILTSCFCACDSSTGEISDISERRRQELAKLDYLVQVAKRDNDEAALQRARELLAELSDKVAAELGNAQDDYDALAATIGPLAAEYTQLQTQHDTLQAAIPGLDMEVAPLRSEHSNLSASNATLAGQIAALKSERATLIEQVKSLSYQYRPYGYGVGGPVVASVFPANAWHYNWGEVPSANDPRQIQMIWAGPPCAQKATPCRGYTELGTCTAEQIDSWAKSKADAIRSNPHLRGANWLIFNEPDNRCQAFLDPTEAAWAWNALHHYVKTEDPTARLYCCGTQPGWHEKDNPGALQHYYNVLGKVADSCGGELNADCWMREFAKTLNPERLPDGLHYHNYYSEPDYGGFYNADNYVRVMRDYYATITRITTENPALGGLLSREIVITEWAALSDNYSDQVSGSNVWGTVMEPVARFLNRDGHTINHVGAAWFVSTLVSFDGHGADGSELYSDDRNEISPLGERYRNFIWRQNPM